MPTFSIQTLMRSLLIWLLLMVAETAQGALRQFLARPEIEFLVRQGSVVTGALVIFVLTWLCFRWMRIHTAAGALVVGGIWVVFTLAFEFGLGRATGLSWSRLLADYDIVHGGLMPLGLLAMGLTPWAVLRLQRGRKPDLHQGKPASIPRS